MSSSTKRPPRLCTCSFTAGRKIVGRDHCAQAARGGDGLQAGDARSHDQHARGSDGSGGGGQHGKDAGQRVGGNNDRFVAAHGAHGGEGVHALRARGAGHQLDRERGCAGGGDLLHGLHIAEGAQEADQDLAPPQEREVGAAGHFVGAVTQHLQDDVGRGEHFRPLGDDLRAPGGVLRIGVAGFDAGAGFDDDFQSGFLEVGNGRRYERNPPLPWKGFAGNTDDHGGFLCFPAQSGELSILEQIGNSCNRSEGFTTEITEDTEFFSFRRTDKSCGRTVIDVRQIRPCKILIGLDLEEDALAVHPPDGQEADQYERQRIGQRCQREGSDVPEGVTVEVFLQGDGAVAQCGRAG